MPREVPADDQCALHCSNAHEFEVWFNSIAAYDDQKRAKQLRCPVCDDADIEKALMAPSVVTTKAREKARASPETGSGPSAPSPGKAGPGEYVPVATTPPPAKIVEMLREMRNFIEATRKTSARPSPRKPARSITKNPSRAASEGKRPPANSKIWKKKALRLPPCRAFQKTRTDLCQPHVLEKFS